MKKVELRKIYKEKRDVLTLQEIDDLSLDIANKALELPIWSKTNYHLFLTIADKREIDTSYIMQVLAGKDKNIVVSKSDFKEGTMRHYLLTDNTTLKVNSYGIPEPVDGFEVLPSQLDIVFVPLLAFDKQGNRIGYGKGFYDRFLAECKEDVIKVGISLFESTDDLIEDIDALDVQLDYCITPIEVYSFE